MRTIELAIGGGGHAHEPIIVVEPVVVQSDLEVTNFIHSVQKVTAVEATRCSGAVTVPDPATPEPEPEPEPMVHQATVSSNPLSEGMSDVEAPGISIEHE